MGFSFYYRSTRPVNPEETAAINRTAEDACQGRTWLSCEPVGFDLDDEGCLRGHSKPNFQPHADDIASAALEGLPDGTARDMLDVLRRISQEHEIDWEISYDESGGPIGFIRGGECDGEMLLKVEAIADLVQVLDSLTEDDFEQSMDDEGDDDAGPSLLPFQPKRD